MFLDEIMYRMVWGIQSDESEKSSFSSLLHQISLVH